MRRTALLLPIALLLLAGGRAGAAERLVLDDGLTVVLVPRPGTAVAAVGAYLRVGRVDEPPRLAGATHFVEHMMFRATGRRPDGNSEREAWSTGVRMQAHTNADYTRFLLEFPADRMPLALDILSDALTSAAFRPADVEEERRVVIEEIRKRAADPELDAFEDSTALAFLPNPLGARVAGTVESVSGISRDELYAWFRRYYRPERTCLVVVGDFDRDATLAAIRRDFASFRGTGDPPPPAPPLPLGFGRYQEEVVRAAGVAPALIVTAALPGYLDPDYLPARFLKEVLEGWVRDRLVRKGGPALATDIWFVPYLARNLLRIRVTLAKDGDAARARDELLGLFARLARPETSLPGINEIAENFRARETLLKERLGDLADVVGRAALTGYYDPPGPPESLAAPDRYTRIDAAAVKRVLVRYLVPPNLRAVFLLPPGAPVPAAPAGEIAPAEATAGFSPPGPVRRLDRPPPEQSEGDAPAAPRSDADARVVRLASGLRFVHLEDNSIPLVGGAIVFPAGSRSDPPGKEGLARLAIAAIPRATRGYESSDLRWRLFAMGEDFDFTANRDSTRISFTVRREDLPETLSTLAGMLANPAFTEDAIREARGRVIREARSAVEKIGPFAGERFRSMLLAGDGYGHEPWGTPESLAAITRADLVRWHHDHLDPSGAVLALVGDVSPRYALRLVEGAFDRPGSSRPAVDTPPSPPPTVPAFAATVPHPSGRNYVIAGASTPGLDSPDAPALWLVQQVLGWQVYQEFTNVRSTAYEAGAFFDTFARAGVLGLYVGTEESQAAEARAWLVAEFARLGKQGPDPALLDDARRAWLGSAAIGSLSARAVAARMAWREAVGLGAGSFAELVKAIRTTTAGQVRAAARRYLGPDRISVLRVTPPPADPSK